MTLTQYAILGYAVGLGLLLSYVVALVVGYRAARSALRNKANEGKP